MDIINPTVMEWATVTELTIDSLRMGKAICAIENPSTDFFFFFLVDVWKKKKQNKQKKNN